MDTRALKNPYHDYDGNPALTRELFDSHGRVRRDDGLVLGGGGSDPRTGACALMRISHLRLGSSRRSFRSGFAARSTNFCQ